MQLLHVDSRVFRRIIGHEHVISACLLYPAKEFLCPFNPLFSQIDGAIHVQCEALHLFQYMFSVFIDSGNLSLHMLYRLLCILILNLIYFIIARLFKIW